MKTSFTGGRTTLTFYPDGSVERHSVSVVSVPGYGSSQSTSQTSGAYVALGDIMFFFWKTDEGIDGEMVGLQVTSGEMYLENTYDRKVD